MRRSAAAGSVQLARMVEAQAGDTWGVGGAERKEELESPAAPGEVGVKAMARRGCEQKPPQPHQQADDDDDAAAGGGH